MGRAVAGRGGDVDLERKLIARLRDRRWSPATAVAHVAERLASRRGASLAASGLRLFEGHRSESDPELDELLSAEHPPGAAQLGRFYEQLLAPPTRRRSGLHVTPAAIATAMVARLQPSWLAGIETGSVPAVLDPAVGGGVFLLAVADALVRAGATPGDALAAQHGLDVDRHAVSVAEAALGLWAIERGIEPEPVPGLAVGDGLVVDLPAADVVVGNPPFLNQLRAVSAAGPERRYALRERWGDLVGAYTDEAWLFLAAAAAAVTDGGQVVLVQPISLLAARHAAEVRADLAHRFHLAGLWIADAPVFDASVEVCAPFLVERDVSGPEPALRRWSGPGFAPHSATDPPGPGDWGRAGAAVVGVPSAQLPTSTGVLAELATATAGFRDQFYGLAPHVDEAPDATHGAPENRLVTVGMLDPFHLRWGDAAFRFAGERYTRPVLDLEALDGADARLAGWVRARRRPKVVVATQTRVVEAVVDQVGDLVPATPVISVEPERPEDLYSVAAVVMAPVLTVEAAARTFGTAMSARAIKLAASQVLALPLPLDHDAWSEGTRLAEALDRSQGVGDDLVVAFAEAMNAAYGVVGSASTRITTWWTARWPQRRR